MDNKERFSNRTDHYVKHRPSYPKEAIDFMYGTIGFCETSVIAEIGAGTGIFTELLLKRGSEVMAVEPNEAMRRAAEAKLADAARVRWSAGSAEETGLPDASADFVVCAQSFHWFDRQAARKEFARILRPGGKTVLLWNSRRTKGTPFLVQFEALLLKFAEDYEQVGHKNITRETLGTFFAGGRPQLNVFEMRQTFDLEGLKGRLLSSSYAPLPGHPKYEPMMTELTALFERNEQNGIVTMEYDTEVYWGSLPAAGEQMY